MKHIDLNCDMGESFGNYKIGLDEEVIKYISSTNIACGYHAGDPIVMEKTVRMAKDNGVAVGAHPGYPDLMGFGRRAMEASAKEITNYIIYQVGALDAFARALGIKMQHVKTHGRLYSTAWVNEDVAKATAEAVCKADPSLIYLVMAGSKGEFAVKAGRSAGLKIAREAYPDRAYLADGSLVPRNQEGAVIHDNNIVAERAVRMASENKVSAVDGTVIELEIDTICVHGDNPSSLAIVEKVRTSLEKEGIGVRPMGESIRL